MFGIHNRYLKPWMKIGAHCEIHGEGVGTVFTIKQIDLKTGCACVYKYDICFGWKGFEDLYRTNKCRKLDKK